MVFVCDKKTHLILVVLAVLVLEVLLLKVVVVVVVAVGFRRSSGKFK